MTVSCLWGQNEDLWAWGNFEPNADVNQFSQLSTATMLKCNSTEMKHNKFYTRFIYSRTLGFTFLTVTAWFLWRGLWGRNGKLYDNLKTWRCRVTQFWVFWWAQLQEARCLSYVNMAIFKILKGGSLWEIAKCLSQWERLVHVLWPASFQVQRPCENRAGNWLLIERQGPQRAASCTFYSGSTLRKKHQQNKKTTEYF